MSQPSDTPETEAFYAKLYDVSVPDCMIEHASGEERKKMRELERQRDAAREDARRLAALLDETIQISGIDWPPSGWSGAARSAIAAHEALTAKN